MTIQQMIKMLKDISRRVDALEQAQKVAPPPAPVEIPAEMEPVVRRGRPRNPRLADAPTDTIEITDVL